MRLYKELVEQLNASYDRTKKRDAKEVVAIRRLLSKDMVITMVNKKGLYKLASRQEVASYTR
jgi:hypothetical protein